MAAHIDARKEKETKVQNLRYMRDKDREKVTGVFRYYEVPGGFIEFVYREYKEDQVETFRLYDGQIYTLPRGVVRHLNKNCWYPEYEHHKTDKNFMASINPNDPSQGMRVGKKIKRMAFESMEFMELNDIPDAKPILTVELT